MLSCLIAFSSFLGALGALAVQLRSLDRNPLLFRFGGRRLTSSHWFRRFPGIPRAHLRAVNLAEVLVHPHQDHHLRNAPRRVAGRLEKRAPEELRRLPALLAVLP